MSLEIICFLFWANRIVLIQQYDSRTVCSSYNLHLHQKSAHHLHTSKEMHVDGAIFSYLPRFFSAGLLCTLKHIIQLCSGHGALSNKTTSPAGIQYLIGSADSPNMSPCSIWVFPDSANRSKQNKFLPSGNTILNIIP